MIGCGAIRAAAGDVADALELLISGAGSSRSPGVGVYATILYDELARATEAPPSSRVPSADRTDLVRRHLDRLRAELDE